MNYRELLNNVKTGQDAWMVPFMDGSQDRGTHDTKTIICAAFIGSTDAAVTICKAMLPGWTWVICGDGSASVVPPKGSAERTQAVSNGDPDAPGRALLQATLEALSVREAA